MSNDIYFWSMKDYAGFSNFTHSPLVLNGKEWYTVEHYFQAMKTLDSDEQEAIRLTRSPNGAKKLGRRVHLREDWENVKYGVMLDALRAKFLDDKFRSLLISTEDRHIYEDSPYDKIWGTGVLGEKGHGTNLLGKALMEIRAEIKNTI